MATSPVKAMRTVKSAPSLRGLRTQYLHSTPPAPQPSYLLGSTQKRSAEYGARNVNDLKAELKRRGLTTTGRKSELVERLCGNDHKSASQVSPHLRNALAKKPTPNLKSFSHAAAAQASLEAIQVPKFNLQIPKGPQKGETTLFLENAGWSTTQTVKPPASPKTLSTAIPITSVFTTKTATVEEVTGKMVSTTSEVTQQEVVEAPMSPPQFTMALGPQSPTFLLDTEVEAADMAPEKETRKTDSRAVSMEKKVAAEEVAEEARRKQQEAEEGGQRVLYGFAGFSAFWLAFGSRFQRRKQVDTELHF